MDNQISQITQLLQKYVNRKPHSQEVLDFIEAALEWEMRQKKSEDSNDSNYDDIDMLYSPFSKPNRSSVSIVPQKDILLEALTLASLAFRESGQKRANKLAEQIESFIVSIQATTETKTSELQSKIKPLRDIIDKEERLKGELISLQSIKEETQERVDSLESERNSLRGQVDELVKKGERIEREKDILEKQKEELHKTWKPLNNEIDELRKYISELEQNINSFDKNLQNLKSETESLEQKRLAQDEEKNTLFGKQKDLQRSIASTSELIECLKFQENPELFEKIQEIWQSLPQDILDKKVEV